MAEIVKIETLAKQATSIEEFRQESGRRAYGMLYFQKVGDVMIPECISDYTDVKQLSEKIELGVIYIVVK